MNFHHFFLIRGPGSPEKSLGTNHRRADFFFFNLQLKSKPECSPVQLNRHCQTVSRTVLRGAGPAPAPRCGSVDAELPG